MRMIRDNQDFRERDKIILNSLWDVFLNADNLRRQNTEFREMLDIMEEVINKNYKRIKDKI